MKAFNKVSNTSRILIVLPILFAMPIAQADFGLTLEADNQHSRYKDPKDDAKLLLGIEYRGKNLNIDKKAVSYDFTNSEIEGKNYAIEAILKSNNRGFEAKDRALFAGMDERDTSIDVGVRGIYKTDFGPVIVEMTRDVNASKGYEADLRLGGITPHNKHWSGKRELTLAGLVGVKYQSDKVVNYHYGVKSNEATARRTIYKAKAATTPYVGLEAQYNFNKHVSVNAGVVYERRDDAIRNSPLTNEKKDDVLGTIGVTYWF